MAEQNKWTKKGITPEDALAKATKKAETASKDMRAAKGAGNFGAKAEEAAVEAVVEAATEYTVVSGDNLSAISEKHYGTQAKWKEIYEANKETIGDNPSLIRVGQVLKLPKA